MSRRDDLIRELETVVRTFAQHTGLAESTILKRAIKNDRFLDQVRAGATISADKVDEALAWFDENWPKDLKWPRTVERPLRAAS